MLDAFRLMLIFTMFDPMKRTIADLFIAVGRPEKIARSRIIQLVVMVGGLFLLAPPFGITGVALAVDIMVVVGIGLLLWQAREYVTFSITRLFFMPGLALGGWASCGQGSHFNTWRCWLSLAHRASEEYRFCNRIRFALAFAGTEANDENGYYFC